LSETTIEKLAFADLEAEGARLYVAAQRYARAFQRDELDQEHVCPDQTLTVPQKISLGNAASLLRERQRTTVRPTNDGSRHGKPEPHDKPRESSGQERKAVDAYL
jgi:hypothetical protein